MWFTYSGIYFSARVHLRNLVLSDKFDVDEESRAKLRKAALSSALIVSLTAPSTPISVQLVPAL